MQKVSIEYSIVSRGTEKYNNCGYMAISKIYNLRRYILNVDHNVKNTNFKNFYKVQTARNSNKSRICLLQKNKCKHFCIYIYSYNFIYSLPLFLCFLLIALAFLGIC